MYCHVSLIQAVVSLNDTLNPDFGTWIEQKKPTILKKLNVFFLFLFFFLLLLNAWNGFINPICCFFLNTLELFVRVI